MLILMIRDRWWFKLLVAYLFIVDITNTACDFATVWEPLIQNWGKLQVLGQSPRFLPADPVTTTLISTPVQLFMAWRVKIITKSNILPIIIALCSLVSLGNAYSYTLQTYPQTRETGGGAWLSFNIFSDTFEGSHNSMTKDSSSTWLISSAVTDVLITVAIVRIMVTRRNGVDANLNNHLARIMRLTVEAGAITTLAVISTLIVFLSVRQGPYFLIWDFSISKLYSLSLIVSLNARPLRDRLPQERPALFLDTSKNTNTSGGSIPSAINSSNESELFPRSDVSGQLIPVSTT
ncbi:hypothetical protein VNI00_013330 [Paramarasmius palmivorus]|uniref:DUF6534 domain-containing protein n=1 Tax=Paramarasmius palmivorus TaxID=297713 RepID=A0AAW0C0W6_9AGAR